MRILGFSAHFWGFTWDFWQLSATGAGRLQLRSRGSFALLRELHAWEKHPGVLRVCRQLIQVLIGDEPEVGMENLLEVKVPEELERSLRAADEEEEEEERRWRKEQEEAQAERR
uniref:Uncharacterized protein n=1 Tax=Corvus moneduloides TaxID=1196302 RepID=A0A8U7NYB9_CORMO